MKTWPTPSICTECGEEYDRLALRPPSAVDPVGQVVRELAGRCTKCTGARNAEADRATLQAKERYEGQLRARQKKRRKKKTEDTPDQAGPGRPGEEQEPWWDD